MNLHKVKLLRSLINVLEKNPGIKTPGFGRGKEFDFVLANSKYRLPNGEKGNLPEIEKEIENNKNIKNDKNNTKAPEVKSPDRDMSKL